MGFCNFEVIQMKCGQCAGLLALADFLGIMCGLMTWSRSWGDQFVSKILSSHVGLQ